MPSLGYTRSFADQRRWMYSSERLIFSTPCCCFGCAVCTCVCSARAGGCEIPTCGSWQRLGDIQADGSWFMNILQPSASNDLSRSASGLGRLQAFNTTLNASVRIKEVTCCQKLKVVVFSLPNPLKHGVMCPFHVDGEVRTSLVYADLNKRCRFLF